MNNSAVEQALVEWLSAAGVSAPVQAGSSAERVANDGPTVIVSVPEIQHVVGPLHRATVNLIVSAPAYQTEVAVYRGVVQAVRVAIANGLASAFDGVGIEYAGLHVSESTEQIDDSRWINVLATTLGFAR